MNKALIAAGLLLLTTAAHAQNQPAPKLPPKASTPAPARPVYWSSYFDTMYDDTLDVTAAANARNTDEFSRSGWERHHKNDNKNDKK